MISSYWLLTYLSGLFLAVCRVHLIHSFMCIRVGIIFTDSLQMQQPVGHASAGYFWGRTISESKSAIENINMDN